MNIYKVASLKYPLYSQYLNYVVNYYLVFQDIIPLLIIRKADAKNVIAFGRSVYLSNIVRINRFSNDIIRTVFGLVMRIY